MARGSDVTYEQLVLGVVRPAVAEAMRGSALITRTACAAFVREFGGKVSNEALVAMIDLLPLPGDPSPKDPKEAREESDQSDPSRKDPSRKEGSGDGR